ncbi:beta-ketoacyl synthase N-terminal-like domain-containing protein [Janthinobacterium fluminis]|uniref:Beta-ketoacyl synthase N-terminal-like domain-containing protein n=1 Tax=Janthinobacterium fluminis TaxID=2987524 RepID=A0ABT5K1T3_9BURK|nr:beta-ketoacyl synthase N-terminal-like domain-containing protein [Janthinobacterium fluminis]MDC8758942.1 beta-ketoacyl synthase N-terminal-like domain-containing protein [Janthinobacterium fluminis]
MSVYLSAPGMLSPCASSLATLGQAGAAAAPGQAWFDARQHLGQRKIRYLSRATRYLLAAAGQTMQTAGARFAALPEHRKGVIVGTNFADYAVRSEFDQVLLRQGSGALSSAQAPNMSVNMPAAQTAIDYGCGAVCTTLTSSATAGIEAIVYAGNALRRGQADALLVGSCEDNGDDGEGTPLLPHVLGGSSTFAAWTAATPPEAGAHKLAGWHWRRYPAAALADPARGPALRAAFGAAMAGLLGAGAAPIDVLWSGPPDADPHLKAGLAQALAGAAIDHRMLALPPALAHSFAGCNAHMLALQFALLTSSRALLFVATQALGSVVVLYLTPTNHLT